MGFIRYTFKEGLRGYSLLIINIKEQRHFVKVGLRPPYCLVLNNDPLACCTS
jgi:hypothetical protein